MNIGDIWTDKMNIGIEPLDDHHKTILRLILEVRAEIDGKKHSDDIRAVLSALISYTKYHFRAEERIMQERGFPELELQRDEHRGFIEKIDQITAAYAVGDDTTFRKELVEHLKNWFVNHIIGRDLRLKEFIDRGKDPLQG